jgi:hypothetical protein
VEADSTVLTTVEHLFQVDAFVNMSRDNETVEELNLCPATDPDDDASETHRYAIWDKIAKGIGNLQALREITIDDNAFHDYEEDTALTCIDEKLSTAMRLGLGRSDARVTGSVLRTSNRVVMILRCGGRLFSFLRTNPALKALTMQFEENVTESHATVPLFEWPTIKTTSLPVHY